MRLLGFTCQDMKSSGWDDRRPLQRAGTKTWLFHCLLHYGPFARLAPRSARFRTSRPPLNNVIPRSNALCISAIVLPLKCSYEPVEIVHKPKPTSLTVKSAFLDVRNRIPYDSKVRPGCASNGDQKLHFFTASLRASEGVGPPSARHIDLRRGLK